MSGLRELEFEVTVTELCARLCRSWREGKMEAAQHQLAEALEFASGAECALFLYGQPVETVSDGLEVLEGVGSEFFLSSTANRVALFAGKETG